MRVETMDFATAVFRAQRNLIHDLMAKVTGAPVVRHNFHFPMNSTHSAHNRRFWLDT